MKHETAQLYVCPDADPVALQAALRQRLETLPRLVHFSLQSNLEGSWNAGDFTLDLCHDGTSTAFDELKQLPGLARLDGVAYQRLDAGQRAPGMRDGIWRTLMFRLRADCSQHRRALERDLLRMPDYITSIGNWQLSRVCSDSPWTHVWQQEFSDISGLSGDYLSHPYHWGWVDRWFDPQCPEWAVDALVHAFCPLPTSLLSRVASLP
ncbi:Dabb family protein [Pseudomonas protegens]|uniref:Dabb family protein n=1 Tax=Pseudomonas protegens TaxID=380021 RepID=UPI0039066452